MLNDKLIINKIYLYKNVLHKVKKIQKNKNRALVQNLLTMEEFYTSIEQSDLLFRRIYTIGEVAKIIQRRPDTIRKYEKRSLIPKPLSIQDDYPSYRNWRFYTGPDVYEMVEFFADRTPGRPAREPNIEINKRIKNLNQKVKMVNTF